MDGLIDLLLTVGYIDGRFHPHEQAFVRQYLDRLGLDPAWRTHFDNVYAQLDAELAALAAEIVAHDDQAFVSSRLKMRAIARFRGFAPAEQAAALELIGALIHADGQVTPQEQHLHDELLAHFRAAPVATPPGPPAPELVRVCDPRPIEPRATTHPILDAIERRGVSDADHDRVFHAIAAWERQRALGNGRLFGVTDIGQLERGARFLDGHVHVMRPDRPTELIVLGDLHGCYSCLKAAVLQTDFIERALHNEDVYLVLLGDYLDRGRFGFEVLRAALAMLVALPGRVSLLRGNHELLMRREGDVVSAVQPAEAVPGIREHVTLEHLEGYRHLFEHMPTTLLFERTLLCHAGIPRDDTFAERYHDLSSLDDPALRFQMMWSDPADTDVVPVEVQRESPRFGFGRAQFRAFMERIGMYAMIRGHEQVDTGFHQVFDLGDRRLLSLFSSGGHDNPDLPEDSRYRRVVPMGLTVRFDGQSTTATPWPLRYQRFVTGEHNGLYR